MKKSLIVTGAASLVLAAMPVVGVFADAGTRNYVTDVLNVKVPDSCTLSATPNHTTTEAGVVADPNAAVNPTGVNNVNDDPLKNYTVTYFSTADALSNGQSKEYIATTINVICNDNGGWKVNAIGSSQTDQGLSDHTSTATDMAPASNGAMPIPSMVDAGDQEAGTNTSNPTGASSWWAMKLTTPTSQIYTANVETGYNAWHSIPASATKVVSGGMTDTTVAQTASTNVAVGDISGTGSNFTTNYKVYIGTAQQADTYTGKVTYTLVHPNA